MAAFEIIPSPDVLVLSESMGSACCVWRDGLHTYVLSAAHVVGGLPEGSGIQWIGLSGMLGLGQTVDPSLYWIQFKGDALDAGLVSVSVAGPFGLTSGYP